MNSSLYKGAHVLKILRGVEIFDGKDLGRKFYYNAYENFKRKDGIILNKLSLEETRIAIKTLRSEKIPVIAIPQNTIDNKLPPQYILQCHKDTNSFILYKEDYNEISLQITDILYVNLGIMSFSHVQHKKNDPKNIEVDCIKYTALLDIYTKDNKRYRLNDNHFFYAKTKNNKNSDEHQNEDKPFIVFVTDLYNLLKPYQIDEKLAMFIAGYTKGPIYVKKLQEFDEKSLWAFRLKMMFSENA